MTSKDKQDVISVCRILADKMSDSGKVAVQQIIDAVKDMVEQQSCEDCISREQTLKTFAEKCGGECGCCDYNGSGYDTAENCKLIKSMPPVTPQQKSTGSWVEKQVVDNEEVEIEQWQSARCSKCDKYHTTPYAYFFYDYNYCPNCGAKMEVEDENKTK